MGAEIIAAIIGAAAALAATATETAVALSSKEKFIGGIPQPSLNKYTFLNGWLGGISDNLKNFKESINKKSETKLESLFDQLGEQKSRDINKALISINGTLGSVNSSLQQSFTEENLAIYFSYFFNMIDQIEDGLLWDSEIKTFFNKNFQGGSITQLEIIVKEVNNKYPPIFSKMFPIRIISTFESNPKHNNQPTYLIGGGGWNAWTWTLEGDVKKIDTIWVVEALTKDNYKNWKTNFISWVNFSDQVNISLFRDPNACLVKGGASNKWVRQGSEKNEDYAKWIIEDIADPNMDRRVRYDDWFALKSCVGNGPYMSAIKQVSGSPQGIACTHLNFRYYQEVKDAGANNVEWDGIWKIVQP